MKNLEISIEWLLKRSQEETDKIKLKKLGIISSFFASDEEKNKNLQDAARSLGRMDMINEIIDEFKKNNPIVEKPIRPERPVSPEPMVIREDILMNVPPPPKNRMLKE